MPDRMHRGTRWKNPHSHSQRPALRKLMSAKPTGYAGLLVTWVGFAAITVSAQRVSMTVRVLDQADLGTKKIGKMKHYVQNSLASIAIGVSWVDCVAAVSVCQTARGPNEFWLRILSQMPPRVGSASIDLLGFTQHGELDGNGIQCVNIFYPMIEELAERVRFDSHQILGAAVLHEIGHLYLGTNREAHSRTGVMCGVWSHRELELVSIGELNFTRDQAARIRTAIKAQQGNRP